MLTTTLMFFSRLRCRCCPVCPLVSMLLHPPAGFCTTSFSGLRCWMDTLLLPLRERLCRLALCERLRLRRCGLADDRRHPREAPGELALELLRKLERLARRCGKKGGS